MKKFDWPARFGEIFPELPPGGIQEREMRKAFAAGINAVLSWQHEEIQADTPDVEACLHIEGVFRETGDYLRRWTR